MLSEPDTRIAWSMGMRSSREVLPVELTMSDPRAGTRPVMEIRGEVDLHSAPELHARLNELLGGSHPSLILDLTGVGFLDSTGIGALVAAQATVNERGGELALVCTQERILQLFAITGLQSVFGIYATVDQAQRSFSN